MTSPKRSRAKDGGPGPKSNDSSNGAKRGDFRSPPHNLDAERAVLGSCLIDQAAIPIAADRLEPEHFYSTAHQHIFASILTLWRNQTKVDLMTVYNDLKTLEQIEEVGGLAYIAALEPYVQTTSNVGWHADIVREKARKRDLIFQYNEGLDMAYDDCEETEIIAEGTFEGLSRLVLDGNSKSIKSGQSLVNELMERLEELRKDHRSVSGLRTGLDHLDAMTLGLHPGDLILIAGRPSQGKTALAGTILSNVTIKGTPDVLPAALFSLEMSAESIMQRIASQVTNVPVRAFRTGVFSTDQWARIQERAESIGAAPIIIDDTPGITAQVLRARARRLKAEHPDLALIIVDYIGLMKPSETAYRQNREREVAEIAGDLKSLARELNIPVIALSQLSRDPEKGQGGKTRKPRLSDLRDSGALEQDADLVLFVYREVANEPKFDSEQAEHQIPVTAEIIIGKQRNGPTGEIQMLFTRQFTRFDTLAREEWQKDGAKASGNEAIQQGIDKLVAAIAEAGKPLSAMEFIQATGATKSTVYRWIAAALESGILAKEGGSYIVPEGE